MADRSQNTYGFLLDAYETEILKITGIWQAFPDSAPDSNMTFRPHPQSRSVMEQMDHQVKSEGRWMKDMLGIDLGDPNPATQTKSAFVEKYRNDATARLAILEQKPESWWKETAQFFDVPRSRAWIFLRRLNHSTHHRGQLVVYLRLLNVAVPSVYGPTADTGEKVVYAL